MHKKDGFVGDHSFGWCDHNTQFALDNFTLCLLLSVLCPGNNPFHSQKGTCTDELYNCVCSQLPFVIDMMISILTYFKYT